jgi:hypothetical protein
VAALVALLREGSAVGKEDAAGALWSLAVNADNQVAIAKEEGALAALVAYSWRCCARRARWARRRRRAQSSPSAPGTKRPRIPSSSWAAP